MKDRPNILLVEDDLNDVEIFRSRVGDKFSITSVNTIAAAIARLNTEQPDAILLDLTLPDSRNRDETVRRIKEFRTTAAIVIISGEGDPDYVKQSILATASGYLVKGRDTAPHVIEAEIKKAINNHRLVSQLNQAASHLMN